MKGGVYKERNVHRERDLETRIKRQRRTFRGKGVNSDNFYVILASPD